MKKLTLRKTLKIAGACLILFGIFYTFGTVGSLDLDRVSLSQGIKQVGIGFAAAICGISLKLFIE